MYRVDIYEIGQEHPLYGYADSVTRAYKCVYNVANYYIRNTMTGLHKAADNRTEHENEVLQDVFSSIGPLNDIKIATFERKKARIQNDTGRSAEEKEKALKKLKPKLFEPPTEDKWFPGYSLLDGIFKLKDNVDYYSLPAQVNQNAVKDCVEAWESYFALRKMPEGTLNGRPKIPKYKRSPFMTAVFTNINCKLTGSMLSFPKTRDTFKARELPQGASLKEVRIKPYYGHFQLQVVYDDGTEEAQASEYNGRALTGDLGVGSLITLCNNTGEPPVIIKGGFIKSRNQWFNKQMALLKSEQMAGHDPKTFHPPQTKRMQSLSAKRDRFLRDSFYNAAHAIRREAERQDATKVIVGQNKDWKTAVNTGSANNQNFVGIPFARFLEILRVVLLKAGITLVLREESYTSKASFLDNDPIPVFGDGKSGPHTFSGKRVHRGMYKAKDGTAINADVNGSCNIGRKAEPGLFDQVKDFSYLYKTVRVLTYKDFYKLGHGRKGRPCREERHKFKNAASPSGLKHRKEKKRANALKYAHKR